MTCNYRGRFAPSPTGQLHFGSLVAAVGSFLDARAHSGKWLVRIDDIDETRSVKHAASDILKTLETLEMYWDEEVTYQTQRSHRYREVLEYLATQNWSYPCACSRSDIAAWDLRGADGLVYPGTCRNGIPTGKSPRTVRLRTTDASIVFNDRIRGYTRQLVGDAVGDFVIRRADGYAAYQLAVVVDDHDQGITDIVRGADLIVSTPRQIYIQQLLNYATPTYAHLPLALCPDGKKISKSDHAGALDLSSPIRLLTRTLSFLGQGTGNERPETLQDFWQLATAHWNINRVSNDNIFTDTV